MVFITVLFYTKLEFHYCFSHAVQKLKQSNILVLILTLTLNTVCFYKLQISNC